MVVLNEMSRFHLALEAIRRTPRFESRAESLSDRLNQMIVDAGRYAREHMEDPAEIRDWVWTDG
jgi:xylulose-5-phosphate/fructose-6-phosphate phosphoketolase